MELQGYRVTAKPMVTKTTVMLYIPAKEVLDKNLPMTDFYVVELNGDKYPTVAHVINKNCLLLTIPSKKKKVRFIKNLLKKEEKIEVTLYPLN